MTFTNDFKNLFLKESTFTNETKEENFSGIDFGEIDHNSLNSRKLSPEESLVLRNCFDKIDYFSKFFFQILLFDKLEVSGKSLQNSKLNDWKVPKTYLKNSEVAFQGCFTDKMF